MTSDSQSLERSKLPNDAISESLHEVQLRYKLALPSFKNLLLIPGAPSRQDILRQACFCTELSSYPFNPNDRAFFRDINDHCAIPYRITEALTQPWHKAFLLVQIDLAQCGWPNKLSSAARKHLHSERGRIYRVLDQVLRCLVDILGQRLDGAGVVAALDVLRSIKAGVWEGNEMDVLQVGGIGPAKAQKLAHAGIKTVQQLSKLEFYHIERLLSRNPPFGQHLLHQLAGFPRLTLVAYPVKAIAQPPINEGSIQSIPSQLTLVRVSLRYENKEVPIWAKKSPWTTLVIMGDDNRLLWFWRGSVKKLTDRKNFLIRIDARYGESVQVFFACENIVGTMQRAKVQM